MIFFAWAVVGVLVCVCVILRCIIWADIYDACNEQLLRI